MVISKEYIGKQATAKGFTHYYMIKNDSLYGIELAEEIENETVSTSEWFSEDKDKTLAFVQRLYRLAASPIHLSELLDDHIE